MSRDLRTPSYARTAAAAVLALCLAACSGDPDQPSDDASPPAAPTRATASDAPPPPPEQGACYRLDFAQATSPSVAVDPVDCGEPHTAFTVHVARTRSNPEPADAAAMCARRVDRFLGGDAEARRLSRFVPVWFTPTEDEQAAGARWARCDVVAVEAHELLATLPGRPMARGILERPRGRRFDLCATAAPGTERFERVICSVPHRWRAIASLRVPPGRGDAYPGQRAARDAGLDRCRRTARDEVRADRVRFGWEWPTAEQWEAGQRHGYCWVPRRN